MNYYEVAPLKLVRKDAEFFTYSSQALLEYGAIVSVPVGKTFQLGVVLNKTSRPSFETRPVEKLIRPQPLPRALVDTARWISKYYQTHLSACLSMLIPRGLLKARRTTTQESHTSVRAAAHHTPSAAQQYAINTITTHPATTKLLNGVTGSGKTLVYKKCIQHYIDRGQSAILLVPEIGLTSQVVDEFRDTFGDSVVLIHSKQSESKRHIAWEKVFESDTPQVIIGPRSALFLPIKKCGIIILDEAHEPSYKQDQSPRYSALRVATVLAKNHSAAAVFGSATLPVSEYYIATQRQTPIISLADTAKASHKPNVSLIDMTKKGNFTQHRFLSDTLLQSIKATLSENKQVLLFHNRRGTATMTLCDNCGWMALDPSTATPLTLHADKHLLMSHISDFSMRVPTSCPECKNADIFHKGIGTKLLEQEIAKRYTDKKIVRIDGDVNSENTLEKLYPQLYSGEVDIIIGTQVIAKGIDLPNLGMVGVVQADAGLTLPDFGARERTFQLLSQAVGRVGRDTNTTTVVVQSYQPKHPSIIHGVNQDYSSYYQYEIALREQQKFPPFRYLAQFTGSYKTEAACIKNAQKLIQTLRNLKLNDVEFLGPTPAFYEMKNGSYRWQITAKSYSREKLLSISSHTPPSHWQYELDPISLL